MSYLKIGKYNGLSLTASTYQFKDVLDPDYEDISNIRMWFKAIDSAFIDYTFAREGAIGYMYNNGGFSGLTEYDQLTMVQNYCVDKDLRDTLLSDEEQETFWELFIYNSENARQQRWSIAKSYISFRLSIPDGNDLGDSTDVLTTNYLRYGIESYTDDNKTGLYDWLNDTHIYSGGTGFSSKTYYTTDFKDGIIDRLNGNVTSSIQRENVKKVIKPSELLIK